MTNRSFVLTALLTFTMSISLVITAAGEEGVKPKKDFKVYIMAGGSTFDIDPLNERLATKGYTELSDGFGTFGAGGMLTVSDRVLLGIEGQMFVGERESAVIGAETYATRIVGGYGFFNAGYLVHTSDRFDLFPLLGIGFGGMSMKIGKTSFDEILEKPYNVSYISNYSLLFNAALEADCKIKLPGDDAEKKFLTIGLRGGYIVSPFDGGWYQDEFELSGAPDGGITGPYVCMTFGMSGVVSPHQVKSMMFRQ